MRLTPHLEAPSPLPQIDTAISELPNHKGWSNSGQTSGLQLQPLLSGAGAPVYSSSDEEASGERRDRRRKSSSF